jgi:hypothetical protein
VFVLLARAARAEVISPGLWHNPMILEANGGTASVLRSHSDAHLSRSLRLRTLRKGAKDRRLFYRSGKCGWNSGRSRPCGASIGIRVVAAWLKSCPSQDRGRGCPRHMGRNRSGVHSSSVGGRATSTAADRSVRATRGIRGLVALSAECRDPSLGVLGFAKDSAASG